MHVVRFEKSCHKCISPLPRRIFPAMEVRDPPERGQHFPREILAVGIIILTKSGRECAHISTADHRCRAASVLFVTVESWKECRLLIARLPPSPSRPSALLLRCNSQVGLNCRLHCRPRPPSASARRILGVWAGRRGGGGAAQEGEDHPLLIPRGGQTAGAPATTDRPRWEGERGGRNTTPLQCSRTTGSAVSCSLALTGKSLAPSCSQNIFSRRRTS